MELKARSPQTSLKFRAFEARDRSTYWNPRFCLRSSRLLSTDKKSMCNRSALRTTDMRKILINRPPLTLLPSMFRLVLRSFKFLWRFHFYVSIKLMKLPPFIRTFTPVNDQSASRPFSAIGSPQLTRKILRPGLEFKAGPATGSIRWQLINWL